MGALSLDHGKCSSEHTRVSQRRSSAVHFAGANCPVAGGVGLGSASVHSRGGHGSGGSSARSHHIVDISGTGTDGLHGCSSEEGLPRGQAATSQILTGSPDTAAANILAMFAPEAAAALWSAARNRPPEGDAGAVEVAEGDLASVPIKQDAEALDYR